MKDKGLLGTSDKQASDKMRYLKPLLFALALGPFAFTLLQIYLLLSGGEHQLGADPAKQLVHLYGEWAMGFLVVTLAVTPIQQLLGWNQILRLRRMLGLFTFFYASMHLLAYVIFLLELDLGNLPLDIASIAGIASYLLLLPLAITSNNYLVRKLRRRWAVLHRLLYPATLLAIVHLVWLSRDSYLQAFIYGSIVLLLLVYRLGKELRKRLRKKSLEKSA